MRVGSLVRSINPEGAIQVPGRLVAIAESSWFIQHLAAGISERQLDVAWKRFPNWRERPVALVEFDEPQKTATLSEWVATAEAGGIPRGLAVEQYANCPTLSQISFPIDDLEEVSD